MRCPCLYFIYDLSRSFKLKLNQKIHVHYFHHDNVIGLRNPPPPQKKNPQKNQPPFYWTDRKLFCLCPVAISQTIIECPVQSQLVYVTE